MRAIARIPCVEEGSNDALRNLGERVRTRKVERIDDVDDQECGAHHGIPMRD